MFTVRKADDRGHFDHGWLNTYHTFSFADYHDPDFMGFRTLRVINEDRVQANNGFGTHAHRDMEIISYVLEGTIAHRDSMGNGSIIRPGEVQRMSAGSGVTHSEKNPGNELVHFYQIWLLPDRRGITPSYEQKRFDDEERRGRFRVVASPDGRDGSVTMHQDVLLQTALLDGKPVTYTFAPDRYGWLQVARGEVKVAGQTLVAGDGMAISGEESVTVDGNGEVLLFDLN
jgi:quercetin 2,3-dioxygenase